MRSHIPNIELESGWALGQAPSQGTWQTEYAQFTQNELMFGSVKVL